MTDSERKLLEARLADLLGGAVGPDVVVSRRELQHAGVPSRYVASLARASRRITSDDDALAVAREWAERIVGDEELTDNLSPRELADRIQRRH